MSSSTSSSTPLPPLPILSSLVGITFSALFSGGNLTSSHIGLPTLLLPLPSSSRSSTSIPPSSLFPSQSRSPNTTPRPRPVTSPFHLARQWHLFFDLSKFCFPQLALISGLGYGVAAYYSPAGSRPRFYFWTATATVLAIFPFTGIIMPTNWKLIAMGDEAEKTAQTNVQAQAGGGAGAVNSVPKEKEPEGGDEDERYAETAELIAKWAVLNSARAVLPLVAIGVAAAGLTA